MVAKLPDSGFWLHLVVATAVTCAFSFTCVQVEVLSGRRGLHYKSPTRVPWCRLFFREILLDAFLALFTAGSPVAILLSLPLARYLSFWHNCLPSYC